MSKTRARKVKQQTTAQEIFVPDRKISETLLDFGDPLLSLFDEDPPLEAMQNLLMIIITAWNVYALALPIWRNSKSTPTTYQAPDFSSLPSSMRDVLAMLEARRSSEFANDPRSVGNFWLTPNESGGYNFRCEGRLPHGVIMVTSTD